MPSRERRRPTMADVARAAGVSPMTVSYVYSRPERVSAETAARVRRSADRLGYPGPHPGARSLRSGRAGSIGVVLGERLTYAFDDPQAARFLAGVAEVCADRGVGLTLVPITGGPADPDRVRQAAVDGFVVWTTADDDPVLDAVTATSLPAVVHAGPARPGLPALGIDDRAAAAEIGHLIFAGATRPAVLSFPLDRTRVASVSRGLPPERTTFPVTRDRLTGYRQAWESLGGSWSDVTVAVCAVNDARLGEAAARQMLADPGAEAASGRPVDAIAAMSDELALGALRVAADLRVAVPQDLRLGGWDDTAAAGAAGLTTVRQDLRAQGAACALAALGVTPVAGRQPWTVVARRTTGAPA